MNTKVVTMETCEENNTIMISSPETKAFPKNSSTSRKLPNTKQERRKNSFAEESFCFRAMCLIKKYHDGIMSSNFPTYFCIFIYILICLTGNIVTGVIWLQHHNSPTGVSHEFDNLNNFTIDGFNETILQSIFDEEIQEHEISSLFELVQNSTENKVNNKIKELNNFVKVM